MSLSVVFMGTPEFAVSSLKELVESNYDVKLVVSQCDKPKGRGMKMCYTPVKEYAINNNIEVVQPEKIKGNEELINRIKEINPDVIIVVAYGKILPKEILEIPKYGSINVHGSLLPLYRGAAPIQRCIMNGDCKTGVTIMYMDEGMDTGDMIKKDEIDICCDDTYGTMYDKLKEIGAKTLIKVLEDIERGIFSREKQGDNYTIAPMINKEECKIDFLKSAIEINNLIRGSYPYPCSYAVLDDGRTFKIHKASVIDELKEGYPGEIIISNDKEGLNVQTGKGIISFDIIQEQNGNKMNIKDYLRGKKIELNQKFI